MKNLIDDPAEAELVQPVRAERVRVVERQALRLDVAVAGAERGARVAVRQRRRQDAVRLLEAVAREEPVVSRSALWSTLMSIWLSCALDVGLIR